MKFTILFLFIISSQNVMSQEALFLRFDESTILKGTLLSEIEFDKIKSGLELIHSKPYKNSISSIYQDNNQHSVFEFFNGCAIRFDKFVKKEDLAKVEFSRVLFSSQRNEITYIIDIENTFHQFLQSEIVSKIELKALDFFGDFYQLKNGNVLANWNQNFSKSKYSILKDIRSMAAIDPGLISFIEEEGNNDLNQSRKITESTNYTPILFEEKNNSELTDIRERISILLNFDKSLLNFSLESIDILESAMIWNCDKISKYELFDLCYPYIGEVVKRKHNLNWVNESNNMILVDNKFNPLEFQYNLQRGITQSDFIPTVKWVVQQLEVDLKSR